MKKRFLALLATLITLLALPANLHAYDYGFILSCGMDFTYHSPTELTEDQRLQILLMLDATLCYGESEPGD